jgi:hypothetical protein
VTRSTFRPPGRTVGVIDTDILRSTGQQISCAEGRYLERSTEKRAAIFI